MTTFNRLVDFNTVPFLARVVYGNTVQAWLAALACALVLAFVLVRIKVYAVDLIRAAAARTRVQWDDDTLAVISRTKSFVLAGGAFYAVSLGLVLGVRVQRVLEIGFLALVFFQLLLWLDAASHIAVRRALKSEYESHGDLASPKAVILSFLLRFVVYVFVFLLFLDNLGVNITALVTGLGIGGIAVALAVQNILGDLIASLSIALDKPFEVGDFIVVGEVAGSVERVGLKTTRIRSLSGEQIIFPNSDLLQSRVRNFKRMSERRVPFKFGLEYSTPPEKLDLVQNLVRGIIESVPTTRFERVHCMNLAASSLDFEVVYWVLSADNNVFMDIQHTVLRRMLTEFARNDLAFAFPTQTVLVARQPAPPKSES